ncbi:MAG: hypothetical protein ABEI27_10540 [Halobellus sp.]|uniref:hypothetical protein n=1 Tax=Halobellus sp. TaxID=1979212 RepID=UPI0035D401F4
MSLMLDAARIAAGINIVLLLVVLRVWIGTYREIRAPFTLASMIFATFLLAENVVALYFYFTAPSMPLVAVRVMMLLQILETGGIGALTYVTWQ